nr:MAG TPA: C2H2 type zinc-finger protein [Caudoviricetes sp.]
MMKLTPEQKTILAYGEARGILKERKSLMRFTEGSGECSDYHGATRMMYGVEEAIRDAWQKRAACRARRRCETCLNRDGESPYTCDTCSRSPYGSDNWEPRKEGE